MSMHNLVLFSFSLFGAVLLLLREGVIRLVTVGLVLSLATLGTAANAQPPTAPRQVSYCRLIADQKVWVKAEDKAAWIQACEGGQVDLTNLEVSHETWPGSVLASVNVTAAGPLVDTETIRVAFTVGGRSFPTTGRGTGMRMADVYFEPCLQPVVVSAVASWKTRPVGTPARSVDFSKQITTTYHNYSHNVQIVPPVEPWGYVRFFDPRQAIAVSNQTPGRTYTVTSAQFFCGGGVDWQTCQSGDPWSLYYSPTLPVTLTCGQSVEFVLQAAAAYVPLLAVITYHEVGGTPNAVSAVIVYDPIGPG